MTRIRSSITTTHVVGLCRGDRVEIGGRPAVVRAVNGTTVTVAWRDGWWWRVRDWFLLAAGVLVRVARRLGPVG